MIRDCEKGRIDLVMTKSVSRFCRNTLDGLETVRRLKRLGVGVFFEEQNVNTLYMDNEMILTFMMSQAQEESRSLSENVKWGFHKRFADGKVYYHYKSFLGYREGADGEPEVDEEQAAVVRRIFARYLMGNGVRQICRDLMADGIPTARGTQVWHDSVVQNILQNEKYIGDALLQKTYIADLFTRQSKKNNGELPKYYVHECHPAIIDRTTFQRVQEEIARRASLRRTSSKAKTELGRYSGKHALNELLICGECGSPYRRKLWIHGDERVYVWRCLNRLEHGKRLCKRSPSLREPELHAAILSAMNERLQAGAAKQALKDAIATALAGEGAEMTLPAVDDQIRRLQERQMELFQLAVGAGADCMEYDEEIRQVNEAKVSLMTKKAELERLGHTAVEFDQRREQIDEMVEKADPDLTAFDDIIVRQLISNIKVLDKERLLIRFKDGTEIEQSITTHRGGKKTA